MRSAAFVLLAAAVLVLAPASGRADAPGRHPAYLHARSDLKASQLHMRKTDDPRVNAFLKEADREVDAAIHELDQAAALDAKDLNNNPPIDANLDRNGRFHKIVELLRSARTDMTHPEDNLSAVGWRDAAAKHIDAALEHIRKAAVTLSIDKELGY